MEIKELIASGILESFVLGETTEKETSDILAMAQQHPEIRQEIERIEETLHATAMLGAVKPPQSVKTHFLSQISPSEISDNVEGQKITALRVTNRRFGPLAAAAAGLLILSTGLNIWLYSNWKRNEEQVVALQTEKQLLTANDQNREASMKMLSQKMALLENPEVTVVVMKGTEKIPEALARIYWNKTSGETFMDLKNLPAAPQGKQYQLWAIVDGKPQDAGVFDASVAGTILKMKASLKPQLFAVTVEKSGGSKSPTLETMVLVSYKS